MNEVPPQIGAEVTGYSDLFWPSNADKGLKAGSIAFSAVEDRAPGFVKELHPTLGLVWRRATSAEIQHRRKTTLWR